MVKQKLHCSQQFLTLKIIKFKFFEPFQLYRLIVIERVIPLECFVIPHIYFLINVLFFTQNLKLILYRHFFNEI